MSNAPSFAGRALRWAALTATALAVCSGATSMAEPKKSTGWFDVRPLGRYVSDPVEQKLTFVWPGSGLEFDYDGANLSIEITSKGENWVQFEVDGVPKRFKLQSDTRFYQLLKDQPGQHRIRMVRRTEGNSGWFSVIGFDKDGELRATKSPDRKILVVGDSMSTGFGIEGASKDCKFSFDTQNHELTYQALAAKRLGADLHTVAVSGRGVVRNYNGSGGPTMSELYQLTLPGGRLWSPKSYQPQAIVVLLGTNDFSEANPTAEFVVGYTAMLKQLSSDYPKARIYAAFGPMLYGDDHSNAEAAIAQALAAFRKDGGKNAEFLSFDWAPVGAVVGCSWHPGRDTHKAMADVLVSALETDLGWTEVSAASGDIADNSDK